MTDTTPAEGTEGLSTAEALDALPIGAVVTDRHGDAITHDSPGVWTQSETASMGTARLLRYGPFRVIYRPSADRPTPPVPAAEDDAVERSLTYARRYWQHGNEPESQAALTILRHALLIEREDHAQARQQVAELRTGIEALADGAESVNVHAGGGNLVSRRVMVDASKIRALLAGSGEQPGETFRVEVRGRGYGKTQAMAERVADAVERRGLPAEVLPVPAPVVPDSTGRPGEGFDVARIVAAEYGMTPDEAVAMTRPAPVVPDSAGVRERVRSVLVDAANRESWDGTDIDTLTDAMLAVVGRGVTAEHVHDATCVLDCPVKQATRDQADRPAARPTGQEPTTRGAGA